jgi:HAE1 family hydrophobic/amphiphilic exporter-1
MRTIVGTPGFWSTSGEESGSISVKLVDPSERERSSEEIANALRPKVKGLTAGADVRVRPGGGLWILRMLRGGGERLEVQIRGYDLEVADRLAREVEELMVDTEGITAARVGRQTGGSEVHVTLDRPRIARLGLRSSDVATQLQTYVQGTRATVLRDGGEEYDVLVRMRPEDRRDLDGMLSLPVALPGGGTTALRDVVRVERTTGPKSIARENQRRVVSVRAVLDGSRDLGSIADDLRRGFETIERPDNFSILVQGESEEQNKNFRSMLVGILLAIALVYMVMAAQFESFLHPLVIMISLPLAGIGVIAMLAATSTTFNLQSFMGCVVLAGIVVNNAIILVDYINLLRRERDLPVRRAVALSARRRLRPILMTSATTILALVPIAVGVGEGGETQAPLARAVIGGLFVSGAISLIVVPVLYDVIERFRERRAQR